VGTQRIADRILAMDVDVLAVQEVENIGILRQFNTDYLNGMYSHQALIKGNDPRFIDVGVLSNLPIGATTTHQTAVHPDDPGRPVFDRDLQEVEIWSSGGTIRLFTLFNNHLKSHFVPHDQDQDAGTAAANARRKRQAETIARIVEARTRPNTRFILLGDMNDPPDSEALAPMTTAQELGLVNAITNPVEDEPPKDEKPGEAPQSTAWSYRHKATGQPPQHVLYDHIWLSPSLAGKQTGAFVDRRQRHGGDGSDHDPVWIELNL
jgi:endonuclease/exonuclease/phosphatase family metal-dependent hydrolase